MFINCMRENSQLTSFKKLRLSCVAPSREGKMAKMRPFQMFLFYSSDQKGYTHGILLL